MRATLVWLTAPVLFLTGPIACKSGGNSSDIDVDTNPWVWSSVDVSVSNGGVLDPKLDDAGNISLSITSPDITSDQECTTSVYASHPSGKEVLIADAEAIEAGGIEIAWDGRDEAGRAFDPGPVQISADLDCGDRFQGFGEGWVYIVRLGVVALNLQGDDNVELAYHKKEIYLSGLTVLNDSLPEYLNDKERAAELADLDDADGQPRDQPDPWLEPHFPPWRTGSPGEIGLGRHNLPAGYVAGSAVEIQATFGQSAISETTGLPVRADGPFDWHSQLPAIRVHPEGFEPAGNVNWAPGGEVTLVSSEDLPNTLGRHSLDITWRYQVQVGDDWVDISGSHSTHHELYLLVGPSTVPNGSHIDASPSVSWIGVVEELADAINGLDADNTEVVMDSLRENLHNDPWFVYNPGDGSYSDFDGPYIYWDDIWVEMTLWLDRSSGVDLYCHSVACVLASLANHIGLDARYLTLGVNFRTHLTRSAGGDNWQRWSFNSHGITEVDGLVWDAAVDIDGDSNPDATPVDAVSPMGLTVEEYLTLLTADPIDVVNSGYCFVY